MKFSYILLTFSLLILISFSCSQFGDSFRLPGENPKDIVLYELDNDYLAPESKEFIENEYPNNNVSLSYVLVGKNTYGFEADLDNDKSLSFDEDGVFKLDRNHPFLMDKYKKGKIGKSEDGDKEGRDKDEKDWDKEKDERDWDKEKDEKDRCFEFIMPFTFIMPDGSTILIEGEDDNKKVEEWYKSNPDEKDRPKVQLPVDISITDEKGNEEVVTVTSDDEIKEIITNCDKKKEGKERCFKILMPYSYNMPDGSSITINEEDDYKNVKEWYENNPDSKDKPELIFPVDIEVENDSKDDEKETKVITINSKEEMDKALMRCNLKDKKRKNCKKLHGEEIPNCIVEYVSLNHPEDKILHTRMLRTKDGDVLHLVKLDKDGVLKFGEDCKLLD